MFANMALPCTLHIVFVFFLREVVCKKKSQCTATSAYSKFLVKLMCLRTKPKPLHTESIVRTQYELLEKCSTIFSRSKGELTAKKQLTIMEVNVAAFISHTMAKIVSYV